jgi:hypothetical protein
LLVRHDRTLDGKSRRYEAIWLPLSNDGQHVTMLLASMIYDSSSASLHVAQCSARGAAGDNGRRAPEWLEGHSRFTR